MKAVPHFGQGNGRYEQMGGILHIVAPDEANVWAWFLRLTDCIRVEHEVHKWGSATRSSGIRGGSQLVVKRIESCHLLSLCIERQAAPGLLRDRADVR